MSNMPPAADPEQDPGQEEMPAQGGGQEQAISVSLSKDEAMQMLQLIASMGEQLDQQLKEMDQKEQGQEAPPEGSAPPPAAPSGNAPDISNGMGPQAAALQQMLIARQKNK